MPRKNIKFKGFKPGVSLRPWYGDFEDDALRKAMGLDDSISVEEGKSWL